MQPTRGVTGAAVFAATESTQELILSWNSSKTLSGSTAMRKILVVKL
jgi:hypothetical protein